MRNTPSCPTNKTCYDTRDMAEDALVENRGRYQYAQGQGPVNVYACDLCGCFHFTSKGDPNERIVSEDGQNDIDRAQEANYWLDKIGRNRF